ncbi:hypothetical protein LSCM1_07281 [Leishmania martiniquensis]|uniref:mitogen-activated protein kinase kinase n=1 Tax=Leishmania martiniquensis TaxID=1580590 RepID=A0A836I165_9TRYP|nr:hypothetical protein LSCM1_07281 [Leishmania martiniquensis]
MSSSRLSSAAASTAMTSTVISSASAASSPPMVSTTVTLPASTTMTQQQQRQLLVSSPPRHSASLHYTDPLSDSFSSADRSYGRHDNSRAQREAAHYAKDALQQPPSFTTQERGNHTVDSAGPSSSLPPSAGERSASQRIDAADSTACLDHDGVRDCAKSPFSAAKTVTTSVLTGETRVLRAGPPSSFMYDCSSLESGVDAAAAQPSRGTCHIASAAGAPNLSPAIAAADRSITATAAVAAVLRREKRRPPSLFSNSPTTATPPTGTTRPVLIPPAVGRAEDRLPTPLATALLPPSAAQATPSTSPLTPISQSLHGQLQRPPPPPLRMPGSLTSSSAALASCAPPTRPEGGGCEEKSDGGQLGTRTTRRDAYAQANEPPSMKPVTSATAHAKPLAAVMLGSTPPSATAGHYGPLPSSYVSAAAGGGGFGGSGTPNATLPVSNSSFGGFAYHYSAGSLGSGVAAASAGGAPTASLLIATTTAGINRPQLPSAARPSATNIGGGGTAAAGVLSPLSLTGAPPAAFTARRRAPPPLLFRLRSPVAPASLSNTVSTSDTNGDVASPGSAAPRSTSSRAATSAAAAAAANAGASSSALATTPLHFRPMVTAMNSGSTTDMTCTAADRAARGSGCNLPATPARSGPFARAHNGSLNQNLNSFSGGTRSASSSLVRLSHDRRTLVAGMFRVSREGCLTVRNVLLLNPTRIDAESATGGAVGCDTPGSLMGGSAPDTGGGGDGGRSRPLQLLRPQRCATTYSPVISNTALTGRMPLLGPGGGTDLGAGGGVGGGVGGLGPMTPYTTGSDWCLPNTYYGAVNARNVQSSGGGGGAHNTANASFTLFSTSMDTPFSPITYSMDSQRLALPSPLVGHQDKAAAAPGPPSQLHSAVREDSAASQFLSVSGAPPQPPPPQATTPNSTAVLGRPPGGGGGSSMPCAQLRRPSSNSWLPGVLGTANATSPPALGAAGSTESILGAGAATDTDLANPLPLPNADMSTWRGARASGAGGSCTGSPSAHANPGGFRGTTAAAEAAKVGSSVALPNTPCAPLPPNVVRLRDLDILSTAVGEGASATVFVAIHKPTGRRLAVKRVDLSPLCLGCSSPYLRSGSSSNGRIHQLQHIVVRELQVLHLTYRSPFMVKVYNAFFIAELAALDIAMEFMHYGSLDHLADCLQKHARMVRESQQQRHRLLTGGDDSDVDDDAEDGGYSAHASRQSSGSVHDDSPSASPSLCDAHGAPPLAESSRKDVSATGVGASNNGGGSSGDSQCRLPMASMPSQLLHSRPPLGEQGAPVSLMPRKLTAIGIRGWNDMDSVRGGDGVPNHPTSGGYKHMYDSDDSLLLDSYSVKSDCGTDDVESDDGSGLVEEPFGVTERLVAVVGEQLLRGVRDMHARGYIHHDIKPGNVLVNEHGVVKLSDFGLSQRCDSSGIGIKNPMLTCMPPVSVVPTRSTTPLQSPLMAALQLTGSRARCAPFIGHAQRGSIGPGTSGHLGSSVVGMTPPEMGSSVEGLLLSSTANSLLAQREGMDVLEAESTSSEEGAGAWGRASRGRGDELSPSSSSSSDDTENCCGTTKYMSPERQRGEPHGKAADIWAVGVTLAEFAVGEYPYDLKDAIDEFDRVSRMEKPVDVLRFNKHRAVPLSTVFADFCRLATLPAASQRPTAQELLEHPFFKQWHRPFNLKDYLAARVPVPSNRMKADYLAKQRERPPEEERPADLPGS